VPTCYRHPGRETYVSCSRCDRPACPDCLRSAAVGQQCVDCVRQASQTTRRPGGAFGGALTSGATVTWTLVGINVVCYLAEIFFENPVLNDGVLFGRLGPTLGVANGQVYRLLSNAFLHEPIGSGLGLLHIVFNMWALIVVGPSLERLLGRVRYLTVYLVSALAGSVLFYLIAAPEASALGASWAIFGLFGAWFVVSRRLRVDTRGIIMLIAINLALSFFFHTYIAWQDHIGGLVTGVLITAVYAYAPRKNRTVVQVLGTVVIAALIVVAVLIRNGQLTGAGL
jgi:membrane associated rhomboid family serine protease